MKSHLYLKRDCAAAVLEAARHFPAVAVTGPRQSGKSTLLRHLFADTHTLVSFDDPLVRSQALRDPRAFFASAGERLVLDEIQYVPELLSHIKMLIDARRQLRGRFIITGSQRFALTKGLGDTLAGRIALFELLPFAESEKRRHQPLRSGLHDGDDWLVHACQRGSFPELSVVPGLPAARWFGSYLQTYLERDIRGIYAIGNLRDFQQFLQLLAARCAQQINLSELAKVCGVAVNTLRRWLSLLEASGLVYLLPPYYRNLNKRITKSPKLYFLDNGLACHLAGIASRGEILRGDMAGALFENYCVQETVKHFLNRGEQPRLYYLRTHNGLEVDLLIEYDRKLYPYEFKTSDCARTEAGAKLERFRTLFTALAPQPGTIVTRHISTRRTPDPARVVDCRTYLDNLAALSPV